MSRTGLHKLQRYLHGVTSTMGCWARPAIFPWLVAYRQTRGRLRMKLKVGFLYVLPLFGLQIAALGCNRANPQAAGPQLPPPPLVSVAKAQAQDVPVYLDEIGKSFAFESVTVTPQVGGRITQRQFQDGADLAKGQLLFVIDPRPYQAQLDSAKGTLAQAKAALELAKVEFARSSELFNSKVIAKQDYDAKKSTVAVDQAQVESAEAALETAQLNLEYCYIQSPIQGRAGARLVDVGNVVQANTTGLLLSQRLDPIYAYFTITERDLPNVQKEMTLGTLTTLVRLPSDPEEHFRREQQGARGHRRRATCRGHARGGAHEGKVLGTEDP